MQNSLEYGINGPLAHLVEHLICNEGVAGSSPVRSTMTFENSLNGYLKSCHFEVVQDLESRSAAARGGVAKFFSRKIFVTESCTGRENF